MMICPLMLVCLKMWSTLAWAQRMLSLLWVDLTSVSCFFPPWLLPSLAIPKLLWIKRGQSRKTSHNKDRKENNFGWVDLSWKLARQATCSCSSHKKVNFINLTTCPVAAPVVSLRKDICLCLHSIIVPTPAISIKKMVHHNTAQFYSPKWHLQGLASQWGLCMLIHSSFLNPLPGYWTT